MRRKRLFAIGASISKNGAIWIHASSRLAQTASEAALAAEGGIKEEGFEIRTLIVEEIDDNKLREAYDGLFAEKAIENQEAQITRRRTKRLVSKKRNDK